MKKALVGRWETADGVNLLADVISKLKSNGKLDSIVGLNKINGRWDLRGAVLSSIKRESRLKGSGREFVEKHGSLKLKNCDLSGIDFSYCKLDGLALEFCLIARSIFYKATANNLAIIASDFSDVVFEATSLKDSFMNQNVGANSGSFINVEFKNCNLSECVFAFPLFRNCKFVDCNFYATNFDGSRFHDSNFVGRVDSPWFRGFSVTAKKSSYGFFNRVNPTDIRNPMANVNFSKAQLIAVSFSDAIDLSSCIFPKDSDKYFVLRNMQDTYDKMKGVIAKEWTPEDQRKGLAFIDKIYFHEGKRNQDIDFIDKLTLTGSGRDQQFGDRFFELLKKCSGSE